MNADPIVAWHNLLRDDGLAQESAGWFEARQRERGLAFGDRPLCTVIRPRFLRSSEYDGLRHASDALLEAFRAIGHAAQKDHGVREQFRLADWENTLLDSAPPLHVLSPLSRLDAFIDPIDGIPRITEYNGETPAGTGYCDALSEMFQALPVMGQFAKHWTVRPLPGLANLLNTLLDTWQQFRGVRSAPTFAIVDWDDVPTHSEFRICRDYFQRMGFRCVIVHPDALEYRGDKLVDPEGIPVDVIYKRVLIHELIGERGMQHPIVRAVVDGAVCMVNPFSCKPLHKKASLAVLSDERNADLFTSGQRNAINRHVPWTRVVEHRNTAIRGETIDLVPWMASHRERLVLKPNDDYGGAGIVLGWEVDAAAWEQAITRALAEPYIVQERIALPSESFPALMDGNVVFDDRIVDTAPFCYHGAWADGLLTRISTSTLVNVTAGGGSTVPTFVVEAR